MSDHPAHILCHVELVASGLVERVGRAEAEQQAFVDCELAALAENRLGDGTDPRHLDASRRADWYARAAVGPSEPPAARPYDVCYWLKEAGQRVGTVALAGSTFGRLDLHLSSFYIYPEFRGRGAARRAFGTLRDVLGRHGLGVQLGTHWTWQHSVRFWLGQGLWVNRWKHELSFVAPPGTPRPVIEIGARRAQLSVDTPSGPTVLLRAWQRAGRLVLREAVRLRDPTEEGLGQAPWHAQATFAVALAMRGWPLTRSAAAVRDVDKRGDDEPEALAQRIVEWEAWDVAHGWRAETPRLPDLTYPTWAQLEARWALEFPPEADPVPD